MSDNLHKGHRKRLKDRFVSNGLQDFEPHNALEILLFYAIPKRDTNDIAHELINRFGSVSAVFNAPVELLKEVSGIGEHAAILLKLIPQLSRLYEEGMVPLEESYDKPEKWIEFFRPKFIGYTQEVLYVAAVDDAARLVGWELLRDGGNKSVSVSCTDIMKFTLRWHVDRIVMAHNHPHGIANPSSADIYKTKELIDGLNNLDITLMDHFVFGRNGEGISMREFGMIN